MYLDYKSVVNSVIVPEYRLKKKHLYICYHDVHEAVAGGKFRIGCVPTGINISNLITKVLVGLNIH